MGHRGHNRGEGFAVVSSSTIVIFKQNWKGRGAHPGRVNPLAVNDLESSKFNFPLLEIDEYSTVR